MSDSRVKRTLEPGSYSTGTLKPEDIFENLRDVAEEVDPDLWSVLTHKYHDVIRRMICRGDGNMDETGYADLGFLIDEMLDLLNDHCPEGHFFGAHIGDGADFGVWSSIDLLGDTSTCPDCNREIKDGQERNHRCRERTEDEIEELLFEWEYAEDGKHGNGEEISFRDLIYAAYIYPTEEFMGAIVIKFGSGKDDLPHVTQIANSEWLAGEWESIKESLGLAD